MYEINPFDTFALIMLLLGGIRTAFTGFVRELSTLAWLIFGTGGGFLFSGILAPLFERWLGPGPLNQVLGFLAIFLLVFIIVSIAAASIKSMLENAELQSLDKGLGFLLGLVEGVIIIFAVFFILDLQTVWPVHEQLGASYSARFLSPFLPYAHGFLAGQTGMEVR